MTLTAEPPNSTRLPGQQPDVMLSSPLAVVALFTEVVRERFRAKNNLAWVWEDNYTPTATEDNTEDGPRKILIEPSFNENVETRNFRPAVFVDKDSTAPQKDVVGNFVGQDLPTGQRAFFSVGVIPIDIEVVASKKGESATLGDLIWFYILAGREPLRKTFNLHDISNPVLGRTIPFDQDKTAWSTHVMFNVAVHFRWSTKPIAPLFDEIVLKFRDSKETNLDAFLLKHYIR